MSDQVVEVLKLACSSVPDQIKVAEKQYQEWQTIPGFYLTLSQILANNQLEENVRLMALVWLKNAVNKYWRPKQPNALSSEEKEQIKINLLQSYTTPSHILSKQMSEIFSRIVRNEPIDSWPALFPELTKGIQDTDGVKQSRALLMLLHVIKGLSARPTLQERKHFEQITSEMYPFMANAWLTLLRLTLAAIQENRDVNEVSHVLEKATLSLKIIKRMNLYGIYKPHQNDLCNEFWRNIWPPVEELLQCRMYLLQKTEYQGLMETFEKYVIRHMKMIYEYQERHMESFVEFAPGTLRFAFDHVFGDKSAFVLVEGHRVHFHAFAIYCFNLMKQQLCLKPMDKVTDAFFDADKIRSAVDKLISIYFLLTEIEMNIWEDDPEEYISEETGDSWKYTLRASAETLFVAICKRYKKEVTPRLQNLVNAAQQLEFSQATSSHDILCKEAIYNAVGLSAFCLYDEIDFDNWFLKYLVKELQIKDPALKIIKRRAIWLIGTWTAVKFNRALRPQVYEAITMLLDPDEDLVVKLVTSNTLNNTLDDFEFCSEQFLPYLEKIFVRLYNLLQCVYECETKMNILKTMSFIIQKMSMSVKPQANQLVEYLPILWEQSGDNYMQKTVIVSTMRDIIHALNEIPETLIPFIYNILNHSTNVDDDMHVYLIDEALELWLKTIHYCKVPNETLVKLASNLIPIIESSSTYLRTCLHIMQAYTLLIPEFFMTNYCPGIVSKLLELQLDMRSEGVIMIHTLYILMLKVNPALACQVLKPALIKVFQVIYETDAYVSELRVYLQVMARVLVMNPPVFGEILMTLGKQDAFERILETMLDKFHLGNNNEEKKLLALAVGSIMTKPVDAIYLNMAIILDKLHKSMLNIVQDDDETGQKIDSLIIINETELTFEEIDDLENYDESTPHFERLRKLGLSDPIHTVPLHEYIQAQISTIRQQLGEQRYTALMSSVDPDILNESSLFLNLYVQIPEHNNKIDTTMN